MNPRRLEMASCPSACYNADGGLKLDDATIRRLNQLNREFYRVTAREFDQTRSQPWPGWDMLLPHIERIARHNPALSVLDVGCGNGRFGVFMHSLLPGLQRTSPVQHIHYHGIDNSPELLERARQSVSGLANFTPGLEERDVIEYPLDSGQYDLVVLFGVLHHIPAYAQRLRLARLLGERVAPGGLLAFACWRFYEYPRFRERIIPWPPDFQVEKHDYLLDWRQGEVALRYCHYVDDEEHSALVIATGLAEVASFRADGQTGDANRYSILQNERSMIGM
jgi:SAM-dependent methyltransferase